MHIPTDFLGSWFTSLTPLLFAFAIGRTVDAPPDEEETPPSGGGDSIAKAGEELLSKLTPEERERPFGGQEPDDEGGEQPAPAEAATEVGDAEPIVRETDGAEWNGEAGRWVLDGKFIAGEAPEGWVKPAVPAAPAKPAAKPEKVTDDEPAPKAIKVTLPGIADRGEEDIEVEVDEEIAGRIQRLKNDGLRRKAYDERMADVQTREAKLEGYEQELEVDPIGFHLNKLSPDQQIEVARALVIEHLDALQPEIEKWLDEPAERHKQRADIKDTLRKSGERLSTAQRVREHARAIVSAAEQLVPEHVDPETARAFMADARRELAEAASAGERVSPETVATLLTRRVRLYGFDKSPARSAAPKKGSPAESGEPEARPVSDRAREVAARKPTKADAAATQARIRRAQVARAAASRVAPVGAGAAPVQVPALPPEAEADVASVSKYLRQQGLPESWTPPRE